MPKVILSASPANRLDRYRFYPLGYRPAVAPDGRIAFVSRRTTSKEVWLTKPDGTDPVRVTNLDQSTRRLSWSHDGNSVYFTTPVNGIPQIVRMSGGRLQPLTHGDSSAAGSLSPDGKWLYFVRAGSILRTSPLIKVPGEV